VTALARHALRVAAMLGHSPQEMLATVHRALRDLQSDADFCTVCLVVLTPHEDGAHLVVVLAGHQPPLIIEPDGTSAPIGTLGTILGMIEPLELAEHHAELRPGQTLLLYTDGVADAGRSSERIGEAGVAELCSAAPQLSLDGLLEHIQSAAGERASGHPRDDVTLLAIQAR
jgi:serine phosphatase RsbU (regulator of sigma subunit)